VGKKSQDAVFLVEGWKIERSRDEKWKRVADRYLLTAPSDSHIYDFPSHF
jgi:hypothetical protein